MPDENLLGEENKGFYLIMANFQWERLLMALGAVGSMQRVLETTIAYALERKAFGRPIGHFQAIRHKVAEMALKLETGRAHDLPRAAPVPRGPRRDPRGHDGQADQPSAPPSRWPTSRSRSTAAPAT